MHAASSSKKKVVIEGNRRVIASSDELQKQAAEIGNRIRQARIARHISQRLIAEATAVTSAAVSLWERGFNVAEPDRLRGVAKVLDVDFDWLFSGKGVKPDFPVTSIKPNNTFRVRTLGTLSASPVTSKNANEPPFPGAVPQAVHGVGVGAEYDKKSALAWWFFPALVLGHSKPESVRVFKVETDRLKADNITRNDFVVVDTGQCGLINGDLYCIDAGHSVVLKHVTLDELKKPKDVGLYDNDPAKVEWLPRNKINFLGRVIGTYCPR